jgi:hypothetical protein
MTTATAEPIPFASFLMLREKRTDAPPALLPLGTPLVGRWGMGIPESRGMIIAYATANRYATGFGPGAREYTVQQYRVINEDGGESTSEMHQDGALSPIGWYANGAPVEGWEALAQSWRDAKAARAVEANTKAAADAATALATIAAWEAEGGGTQVDTYHGALWSAVSPTGAWRLWRKTGTPVAREFKVGDVVRHGSYNLDYLGKLVKVTKSFITYTEYGKEKRQAIRTMAWRNIDFDLEKSLKRNAEWYD